MQQSVDIELFEVDNIRVGTLYTHVVSAGHNSVIAFTDPFNSDGLSHTLEYEFLVREGFGTRFHRERETPEQFGTDVSRRDSPIRHRMCRDPLRMPTR
ncbi:hypothetical protein KIPB_001841 [Kipferlia bialata]|uniref:Uncharacterized protein n=1 Tax=Kipferlia bialata TaxID=797122 RepID=A0A391NU75_9EUKA|nr:hypothetical protein KIPB_001841 [Kipferlia bialata]|eukprot:g1841.t1